MVRVSALPPHPWVGVLNPVTNMTLTPPLPLPPTATPTTLTLTLSLPLPLTRSYDGFSTAPCV